MKEFLAGIYIGLTFVAIIGIFFGLVILIYFLAKNNIFFTFVQEGTAKVILTFGQFSRAIISYVGHELNEEWEVVEKKSPKIITELLKKTKLGGLKPIGIPLIHSVHAYKFKWASFEQIEGQEGVAHKVVPHEKIIDYILVQDDVYYTFLEKAETKGMVPIDVSMLLTIKIVNVYKALFKVQDWLEATLNQIKPSLREFIGTREFEELTNPEGKEKMDGKFKNFLTESKIDEFLKENYGVELRKAEIVTIDPSGERGTKYVEAASKKWEAEKEKDRIKIIANAEAKRIEKVYDKIQGYGDMGLFIQATEAIKEAGKSGNLVIFPFGSVQSLLEGWLGKKEEKGGNK